MDDSSYVQRMRNLVQEEAAYLIAPKTVSINRLRPDGDQWQVPTIIDGVVQWSDFASGGIDGGSPYSIYMLDQEYDGGGV